VSVPALLDRCRGAGIVLREVDGALEYDAPDTCETDAVLAEVRTWRHQITRTLAPWLPPRTVAQIEDPRPDLADDSAAWAQLLRLAWLEPDADEPAGCYGALHFIRCGGAGLDVTHRPPLFARYSPMVPVQGDNGEALNLADETAWSTPEEWERTRAEVLAPHRKAIARVLRVLAEECAPSPAERELVAGERRHGAPGRGPGGPYLPTRTHQAERDGCKAGENRVMAGSLARALTGADRTAVERALAAGPLPTGPFDVILADPPWSFATYSARGDGRSAKRHYAGGTMTPQAILDLGPHVRSVAAPTAVLALWATWPTLPQALATIDAWGFTYKTCLSAWVKITRAGTAAMGTGYWTRANTEPLLLATRGAPTGWRADRGVPQVITTDFPNEESLAAARGPHSRKPDEVFERLERLLAIRARGLRCLELFARPPHHPDWMVWGLEADPAHNARTADRWRERELGRGAGHLPRDGRAEEGVPASPPLNAADAAAPSVPMGA